MVVRIRRGDGKLDAVEAGEFVEVSLHEPHASLVELERPLELRKPDRGVQVGHVVLVARGDDVVEPARVRRGEPLPDVAIDAVEPHAADAFGDRVVGGDEHAAFAGGHGLVGIEAEAARGAASAADHGAAGSVDRRIARGERVRRVLDQGDPARLGDGSQRFEVAREPAEVDRHRDTDLRMAIKRRREDLRG